MPSEISGRPDAAHQEVKQRKALRTFVIFLLLSLGLVLITGGLPGLVSGQMRFGLATKGFRHRAGLQKQQLELSDREAHWLGGGLVAVGCGFLLALALVPRAVDSHFRRKAVLSMPVWQLGILGGAAILVIGGVMSICASFNVK
jgi:hypothetical protein